MYFKEIEQGWITKCTIVACCIYIALKIEMLPTFHFFELATKTMQTAHTNKQTIGLLLVAAVLEFRIYILNHKHLRDI